MSKLFYFFWLMRKQLALVLLGFLLSLITLLAGIGLLSLSGYLICGAAFSGIMLAKAWRFNYMLPAAGIRFFALVRIASRYGDRLFSHSATFRILGSLRLWLYQKIDPLAPALFLKHRSGDLLSRLVNDIDALDHLYIRVLTPLVSALSATLIIWYVLSYFNHQIAVTTTSIMLVTIIFLPILFVKLGKKVGAEMIQQTAKLRILWIELQQGMANLLLLNVQSKHARQLHKTQIDLINTQKKMSHLSGLSIALVGISLAVSLYFILYLGIPLLNHNQLNGAYLGLMALGIMAAYEAILPLPTAFQYLGKTEQAASRLLDIVNEKAVVQFTQHPMKSANFNIELQDVSFRYENQLVNSLDNINLHIKYGDKMVIQGPTGSGKTTLVQLLTRFWDPSSGDILLGNVSLRELSENDLRNSISLVEQRPHIFNTTIRDNLRIANRQASESQLWNALTLVGLSEMVQCQEKQLDAMMGEFGGLFSGGQIRRFAVARAILHDAPIIILDEPTEGLDQASAKNMLDKVMLYWKEKTVLIISHQEVVLPYSNRIIQLRDGVIQ